jgi:HAD superfamily hydrolase (TIGR01509 family)
MPALLFDLDGTVADTNTLHELAWQQELAQRGVLADHEFFQRKIAGRRNAEIVRDVLPGLEPSEAPLVADSKEARFRQLAREQGLREVPGLGGVFAFAHERGFSTALVTNAPRINANAVLSLLGVQVDVLVCGEELPLGKPDPLPYRTALERLGCQASSALAFEDSPPGVRAAASAGIGTVGVLTGHSASELSCAGAALCVVDFRAAELWQWLDRLR